MAGRPRRTAMILELEKRTRTYFDIEPEKTHLDYACAWVEDGESLRSLAADITESVGETIERAFLSRYIYSTFPDAEERLAEARRSGAGSMVEHATELADSVEETREAIMKAKLQIDSRLWRAGHADRTQFGEQKAPAVHISISGLHLDALRLRPVEVGALTLPQAAITSLSSPAEESPVQDAEYQVLSE